MLRLHHREVRTQQPGQRIGQHGHAILATLAIAHRDLPRGEIDILDPQAHAFHQAHAGAVEQPQHQARGAIQPRQHGPTSAADSTVGRRAGFFARSIPSSHGKGISSTSR